MMLALKLSKEKDLRRVYGAKGWLMRILQRPLVLPLPGGVANTDRKEKILSAFVKMTPKGVKSS